MNITNYNVLIDGRKFYYQPMKDQVKRYEEDTEDYHRTRR